MQTPNHHDRSWQSHTASNDLMVGLGAYHVWLALGWHDIRQRYRRSVLGPFWFTLSSLIMVGVLGVLYSTILNQEIYQYLPYLGVGLVVWQYISACINEAGNNFIGAGHLIKQIRMPLTIHVARSTWRNFVILMHSLPVVIVLLLVFGHSFGMEIFLLIPALTLLWLQGIWIGVVLGVICARYRDVLPIVNNLVQVAFFFTPVMWETKLLQDRMWIADFNPLHHLIEIVRSPVLGRPFNATSWMWSIGLLLVGFALAQFALKRTRNRVAYWL